jgi:hypothetical protein
MNIEQENVTETTVHVVSNAECIPLNNVDETNTILLLAKIKENK